MPLEEDIAQIEESIRRLQIEWDKFFSGIERKPPNDLKNRVEALLRRYANAEIRGNTERFRFQTLTAKYNTLNELWSKKLRAKEEGKLFGVHGLKADILPPPPPAAAPRRDQPAEFRVRSPERDADSVRALYDQFLAAREQAGDRTPVKFDSFRKLIGQQTSKLMSEKGGQAVEFRLETKGGKVSLKAKVVK